MENRSLTVSQLNKYIGGLMEFDELLSNVTVQGELSNFKRHSSGTFIFRSKTTARKSAA
jgi:exodeoxyribonuclease VII large subunit